MFASASKDSRSLFSVPPGPVASADSDETGKESDGNEDQDTAGSLSFKVCARLFHE
jgi:hypothetical protein